MIVTDLRKRRHRLTALFFQGREEPVLLDTETLLLAGIRVGQEVSEEDLSALQEKSNRNRAYEKALYLLEYRPHSRQELLNKVLREYPEEAALEAVERVAELGLLNDEQYAADLAQEFLNRKGYGVHRARQELMRRGIDRDLIDTVLQNTESDPEAQLIQIITKKYKPVPTDRKGVEKVIAAMVRRGYEFSQVRHALQQIAEIEVEEPWQ